MNAGNVGSAGLMQQISLDVMKKAMDVEAKQVLSVLQSAGAQQLQSPAQPTPDIASLTGLGQKIDVKG